VADVLIDFIEEKAALAKGKAAAKPNGNGHAREFAIPTDPPVFAPCEVARFCSASASIPSEGREDWLHVGFALKWLTAYEWPEDLCFRIWNAWSQMTTRGNYVESDQRSQWQSFKGDGGITIATVIHMARQNGWQEESPIPAWATEILSNMARGIGDPPRVRPPAQAAMSDAGLQLAGHPVEPAQQRGGGLVAEGSEVDATRAASTPSAKITIDDETTFRQLAQLPRPEYDRLRKDWAEKLGIRVGTLDDEVEKRRPKIEIDEPDNAFAEETGEKSSCGLKQADILIELAQSAELFHAPDGVGFADVGVDGHRETWPIRGKGFRRWLTRCFFEETQGAPSSEALQSALNVIEAKAHFDGPERLIYIRIGGLDGRLYIDLCDDTWRAVEIDANDWRVVDAPPVRFRRAAGMKPLPVPVEGGSVESLRSFLNVKTGDDFVLVVAWALACLRDHGPYPVIVLSGEQGSAKSTFSKILRGLLDPNVAPLRALPREDRDLFIAANNGHVLVFDNLSGLPAWISDTLCRLATGGGFATRQLYSDQDEVLFESTRPVILNGIEETVTRPDLADRALFLTLEPIPDERRRTEEELMATFEAERPRILGALLDAVVEGLKRLPDTHLAKLPRMADFARWVTACETALWTPGTFGKAYCKNQDEAVEGVIDADPVAAAVRTLASGQEWTGTASELLKALSYKVDESVTKTKAWPDTPRALSGRLRRAASSLRKAGTEIGFERGGRARIIHITTTPPRSGAES
jgi:Primase C terminal 2 (PriCT-2)